MAQTITAIVVLRNPVLTGDSRLSDMIELATPRLSTATFGDHFNEAVALLVLHMYEIGDRGGAGGPVTSEKEGQLARSFAAAASSGALSDTSWGRELERLTRSLHFFPRTRMMT
ncbi:MAG: DUF4054 domain-containing protein [Candidatus Hydrogenedentes bacterium]|nr:DUF4054 domain-containing protein [Candidatus Hydrogenedentota bacterium]